MKFFLFGKRSITLLLFVAFFLNTSSGGAQTPARSGGRLGNIIQRGVLVVGLQRDYRPFHIEGSKAHPGLDVELTQILAKSLKVDVRFQFYSLQDLLTAAATGQIDLALGGISASLDRVRFVNFTDPYLIATPAALVTRDVLPAESGSVDFPREKVEGLADLRKMGSLELGVKRGSTNEQLLREVEEFSRHRVVPFDDQKSLVEALQSGKVDGIVGDDLFIKALLQSNPTLMGRFVPLLKSYREDHISMATAPGDMEFLYYLNFFLGEMRRTSRLKELMSSYFESDDWIHE